MNARSQHFTPRSIRPAQTARLAHAAIELADARQEILQLRTELAGAKDVVSDESNARISDLLRERTELELELEAVRNRAAESLEEADEERRRISEERAQWAAELRQLSPRVRDQNSTTRRKRGRLATPRSFTPV